MRIEMKRIASAFIAETLSYGSVQFMQTVPTKEQYRWSKLAKNQGSKDRRVRV